MARCTGILFYPDRIEAAEVSGSPSNFSIVRSGSVPVTGSVNGNGSSRAEALKALFSELRLTKDPVVAGFSAQDAIIRSMTIPFQRSDHIARVLRTHASEHIHGHALDRVILAFRKVQDLGEGSRILVFGMPKDPMRNLLNSCIQARLDPQVVGLDLLGLYNLGMAVGVITENRTSVLVNVDANATGFVVARGTQLVMVRPIKTVLDRLAVFQMTETLSEAVPDGESERKPEEPSGEKAELLLSAASGLALEIRRSLLSASLGGEGPVFFISGCLGAEPVFLNALGAALESEVSLLTDASPPWGGSLASCCAQDRPFPAAAAGLALKGLAGDEDGIDFRQEEFAFTRKFERVKVGLCFAVTFAFLLFGLLGFYLERSLGKAKAEHKEIANRAYREYRWAMPKSRKLPKPLSVNKAVPRIKKEMTELYKALTDEGVAKDIPPIESALSNWNELSKRIMNADGVNYLLVNKITMTQTHFGLSGLIDSPTAIDSILNQLKTYPAFSDARTYRAPKKQGDGNYSYDIRGTLRTGDKP